jgi:hypothetical protein
MAINTTKQPSFHLLEENVATLHISVLWIWRNRYIDIFKHKIDQLISAGLVQKTFDMDSVFKRIEINTDFVPKQLTLEHLGLCFIIISVCWALCLAVFFLELLVKKLDTWRDIASQNFSLLLDIY